MYNSLFIRLALLPAMLCMRWTGKRLGNEREHRELIILNGANVDVVGDLCDKADLHSTSTSSYPLFVFTFGGKIFQFGRLFHEDEEDDLDLTSRAAVITPQKCSQFQSRKLNVKNYIFHQTRVDEWGEGIRRIWISIEQRRNMFHQKHRKEVNSTCFMNQIKRSWRMRFSPFWLFPHEIINAAI